MASRDPKLLKFKQAADKVKFQTRPGPALISLPEKPASDKDVPPVEIVSPTEKKKTIWSKIFKFYRRVYKRLQLKHLGLIFVTIGYAFFGGWLFSWLESENEATTKSDKIQELNTSAYSLSDSILSLCQNSTISEKQKWIGIFKIIENYQQEAGLFPKTTVLWDLWGGMFFAGTVITTIGYGHYVPVTYAGRVAVMIYALIGIPMVLAMLTDFGKLLTNCLNNLWSRLHYALAKCWQAISRKEYLISQEGENDIFSFPIPLALFLIVGWIFFCSALFCIWETSWNYFTAFYFFFISLSTIGLGDITPDHPKFMICAFPLVIIGLSFVSLVLNLIQNYMEKLKEKTTGFVEEQFGLDEETESEGEGESPSNKNGSTPDDYEKLNRTALGIIQTMQRSSRARRRRIGVQTEDSYLRDSQAKDNESAVVNSDLSSVLLKMKKNRTPDADKISVGSFETVFYEAHD